MSWIRILVAALSLGLAIDCTSPVYIVEHRSASSMDFSTARFEIIPFPASAVLGAPADWMQGYGSAVDFSKGFNDRLAEKLALKPGGESKTLRLELVQLWYSRGIPEWSQIGGSAEISYPSEYRGFNCLYLDFRVTDAAGSMLLKGTVQEEFLTDFPRAATKLQNHLANYLRGRMPAWNTRKATISR